MYSGGFTGKILRIDLTNKEATTEPLSEELARDFVGGAGLGTKYLFDEVSAGVDPLGPDNRLIFASGPFTGTTVPCASRMAVTAKSPLTGAVGMSLTGGFFPAEFKFAGYDALIVQGQAKEPTYVWIKDGKVQFRDASSVWGTTTGDCQQMLKDGLKDQNIRIACIGPAGERQVKLACIINERRAAGRKGLGAVMGAKNLKAIAVRGSNEVPIANEEKYKAARDDMRRQMRESPVLYPEFSKLGTPMVVDVTSAMGILAAKNWQATGKFDAVDTLGVEAQKEVNVDRNPCQGCPVACSQLKLARSGKYAGAMAEGPEFESFYSLGTQTGVDNMGAVIAADRLCDELGMDTMSAGVAVGFAMELFERGLLSKDDAGGLDLMFGNDEAMMSLLEQMAFREGLGDVLADGVRIAAEKLGDDTAKYAMHVKGLELPAYDVRGAKSHGLNYATAYTGADHNRGYAFQEIFGIPVPKEYDRFTYEGKGELCKWNQDIRTATCDCPTMCAFLLDMAVPATATENTAALLEAVTGMEYSPEDVWALGERVNNLARAFNAREGFGRGDDTLPKRLMEEPLTAGSSKGECIPQADLDAMLDEYYDSRGWDLATGTPTRERLESLRLGYVADELEV
ncbi:MAG TPA: aldehyde ferredoxin oxidoreductase family protein [Thermoleophilia bacterium]|nr:aldehyde ferredoxin oxidoreductase family protein [Thermoleophilia bacterium]